MMSEPESTTVPPSMDAVVSLPIRLTAALPAIATFMAPAPPMLTFRISAAESAASSRFWRFKLPELTNAFVSCSILFTEAAAPIEASLLTARTAATVRMSLSLSALTETSAFFAASLSISAFVIEASTVLLTSAAAAAPCTATLPAPPMPTPIVRSSEVSSA